MKLRIMGIVFCLALLASLLAGGIKPAPVNATDATTSIRVTKYAADGTTIVGTTQTVTYDWMKNNLPVQGDGNTHYFMQGPTYDPNNPWDPGETVNLKDKGAVKGTDIKDLCNLPAIGGANAGDQIQILAPDGIGERFQYANIYHLNPNQGKMVICWYTKDAGKYDTEYSGPPFYTNGAYVPEYANGMQLVFMPDSPNSAGKYVFGHQDMQTYLPQANWWYNEGYPSVNGLSTKWISEVNIFSNTQAWTLQLVGPYSDNISQSLFENGVVCADANHGATWNDGSGHVWKGLPLWLLCGWADDANNHLGVGAFNDALARAGYTVRLTSENNTTCELDSADVARKGNIILANTMNGQQLSAQDFPLKLVGPSLTPEQTIGKIVKIELVDVKDIDTWQIPLSGAVDHTLTQAEFEDGVICQHGIQYPDGSGTWKGLPLYLVCGFVDDSITHGQDAFNDQLAGLGYKITVSSDSDNYTFDSSFVAGPDNNSILVAGLMNGEDFPITYPPTLVGSAVTGNMSISNITSITLTDLPPTITASAGANGSISPSGEVLVGYNADQSFTITPDPGYVVADVLVDNGSVGARTSYTFDNVTANHTIHATFALGGTPFITVTKYAGDNTILASENVTYLWMQSHLDVQGDGIRHQWLQGPVFEGDVWDPTETINIKDWGANMGTDVKDLCELVGGMSPGDTVQIKARDNLSRTYDYPNVYAPDPRQGKMVISWYTKDVGNTLPQLYPDGAYVPEFAEGMRLVFFAETTNSDGKYVFGNWDQHECMPQNRWYFYDPTHPTTTGHSVKYVSQLNIHQPANITVTYPNDSDDSLYIGETDNITWNPATITGKVNVYLSRNAGAAKPTWTAITPTGGVANSGSFSWKVTGPVSNQAKIKVASVTTPTAFDISDASFSISGGTITVSSPVGGDTLYIGETDNITWTSDHVASMVIIYISRNAGATRPTWTAITPKGGVPNTGTYPWLVTKPVAINTAKVKIARADLTTVFGISPDTFNISGGTINVDTPDTAYIGETDNITWTSDHVASMVIIYISRNAGATRPTWTAITPKGGVPNTGTYPWLVTKPVAIDTAKVKIARADLTTVFGISPDTFNISGGTINVDTPDTAYIGETDNITWTSDHVASMVIIYISRNAGATRPTWTAITPKGGVPNTGTYPWLVTKPVGTAKVKIARADLTTAFGISPDTFNVSGGTINVTSPAGGETWHIGDTDNITWSSPHIPATVKVNIYVSRNGGSTWTAITPTSGVLNTGAYLWLVTKPAAVNTAKVKVARADITTVFGTSEANFTIQ